MANETPHDREMRQRKEDLDRQKSKNADAAKKKAREKRTDSNADRLSEFHRNNPRWKPGRSKPGQSRPDQSR